jgi:hypothetical protein
VYDVDVGDEDLQQCADAVIRLYAEYLYSNYRYGNIRFEFTSGDTAYFNKWIEGYRPAVSGNRVSWHDTAEVDSSYDNFREYLKVVFTYAGTISLERELRDMDNIDEIRIGDVFVQGGSPGHAIMVVDVARNEESGKKVFLLAQGFTPAQDIHVLSNPNDSLLGPWYSTDFGEILRTPEWTFKRSDLKRGW